MQLGHQAANCTNGTINWKQIYGDEAFRLKAPLYESDFERLRKAKQVDYEGLERRAKEYAKVRASHATPAYSAQPRNPILTHACRDANISRQAHPKTVRMVRTRLCAAAASRARTLCGEVASLSLVAVWVQLSRDIAWQRPSLS